MWLLLAVALAAPAPRPVERVRSKLPASCVLDAVAGLMGVTPRADVPLPRIRYETDVPLSEFQDAVAPQWGFRPDVFSNAYVPRTGEIFIIDDAGYYRRLRRTVEDSLAHELAHFVQAKYRGIALESDPEGLESDAVDVQTRFREALAAGRVRCGS